MIAVCATVSGAGATDRQPHDGEIARVVIENLRVIGERGFLARTIVPLQPADSATEMPWEAAPTASLPTNLLPCWVQTPLVRVKTHAAPVCELSSLPPEMAVFPSADSATDQPWWASTAPVPTSLLPCWVQTPPLRV
jgi:hypothetical protein